MTFLRFTLAACTLFTVVGCAARNQTDPIPQARDVAPEAAGVQDLAWLAGAWHGEVFGQPTDEIWSRPSRDTMMGMMRMGPDRTNPLYEFFVIEHSSDRPDGTWPVFHLLHFSRGLEVLDESTITLPLVDLGPRSAKFAGEHEGKPLALRYTRTDADTLVVELTHQQNGSTRTDTFGYERVREK